MADNIQVTEGSGRNIAGDEIAGVLHQRVKLSLGADGTAVDAVGGSGNSTTGTVRIVTANDSPEVTALAALATAVQIGEVQSSPTAYTLLARIKDLLTGIVLAAGSAVIGRVGIDQTTDGVTNLVAAKQSGNWTVTNVSGTVALPTGAATAAKQPAIGTAGSASADVITVQGVAGGVAIPTTVIGGTPAHYLSAASTNQTNVKASAGTLLNVTAINTTATVYYLKLHDTASTPTAGTTAVVQCYAIPASTSGNGFTISVPMSFANGIAFTLVGGIADNDTANAATGVTIDFVYR